MTAPAHSAGWTLRPGEEHLHRVARPKAIGRQMLVAS